MNSFNNHVAPKTDSAPAQPGPNELANSAGQPVTSSPTPGGQMTMSIVDLSQMKQDLRLVSFVELSHNIFALWLSIYCIVSTIEFSNAFNTFQGHPPNVTHSRKAYLVIKASGIEPQDVNVEAFPVFVNLGGFSGLLSCLGIFTTWQLHKGTDVGRGLQEIKKWSTIWQIVNVLLSFSFFVGAILAYVFVNATFGTIAGFMFSIKLGSSIIVQRLISNLRLSKMPQVIMTVPSNVQSNNSPEAPPAPQQ